MEPKPALSKVITAVEPLRSGRVIQDQSQVSPRGPHSTLPMETVGLTTFRTCTVG